MQYVSVESYITIERLIPVYGSIDYATVGGSNPNCCKRLKFVSKYIPMDIFGQTKSKKCSEKGKKIGPQGTETVETLTKTLLEMLLEQQRA